MADLQQVVAAILCDLAEARFESTDIEPGNGSNVMRHKTTSPIHSDTETDDPKRLDQLYDHLLGAREWHKHDQKFVYKLISSTDLAYMEQIFFATRETVALVLLGESDSLNKKDDQVVLIGTADTRFSKIDGLEFTFTAPSEEPALVMKSDAAWQLLPTPHELFLTSREVQCAPAGGPDAAAFTTKVKGRVVFAKNRFAKLHADIGPSWDDFELVFDPTGDTSETRPTLLDLFLTFEPEWLLPEAIRKLGSEININTLSIAASKADRALIFRVAMTNATPFDWYPLTKAIKVQATGVSLDLKRITDQLNSDRNRNELSGKLGADVKIFGVPAKLELTYPDPTLKGRLPEGRMTLLDLVTLIIGEGVPVPDYLAKVGLLEQSIEVNLNDHSFKATSTLVDKLPVRNSGWLLSVRIVGYWNQSSNGNKICLGCTFENTRGTKIDGELCYPFTSFKPKGEPDFPFPPGPVPPPKPDPIDYAEACRKLAALLAAGNVIATALFILRNSYGAAAEVAAGAAINVTEEATLTDLTKPAVAMAGGYAELMAAGLVVAMHAGALLALGDAPKPLVMARGVKRALPDTVAAEMARALLTTYSIAAPVDLAKILHELAYQGGEVGPVVLDHFSEIDGAAKLTAVLKEADYPVEQIHDGLEACHFAQHDIREALACHEGVAFATWYESSASHGMAISTSPKKWVVDRLSFRSEGISNICIDIGQQTNPVKGGDQRIEGNGRAVSVHWRHQPSNLGDLLCLIDGLKGPSGMSASRNRAEDGTYHTEADLVLVNGDSARDYSVDILVMIDDSDTKDNCFVSDGDGRQVRIEPNIWKRNIEIRSHLLVLLLYLDAANFGRVRAFWRIKSA